MHPEKFNVYIIHLHPITLDWVVDGELGRVVFPQTLSKEEVVKKYQNGEFECLNTDNAD